jgi:ADP-heptose:LPS heptosyltransferase
MSNEIQDQLRISKEDKFIIFHIDGGHGKNILATAVVEALKKQYPEYKIIIATAWDAPWYGNPNVFRVYNFGQMPYFYDNYIFDDTKILRIDPYQTEDHTLQRKHLIKTWCDLYDIPYDGELPKLYINPRELEIARDKIKPNEGKPIMLLQTHGGMPSSQYSLKSWARDMPIEIAQAVVNYFSKSYRILHLRLDEQPDLKNVEVLNIPHRELYAVFPLSKKRLFIDSFALHTAAALDLPSTVCWIANKPEIFGYDIHKNIMPNAEIVNQMNKFSYTEQYDISGQIQQFPFDTVNLFDSTEIIKTVTSQ